MFLMTRREIEKLVGFSPYWSEASNEERVEFCKAMRGLNYGFDPCLQALAFFINGWRRAKNSEVA